MREDDGDLLYEKLREYQRDAINGLRQGFRDGHKSQVLVAPTGSGKTLISAYLMKKAAEKKTRVSFLVDRVSLVDQTSDVLDQYGIDHGVIQASHWRFKPWELIQVCSAQTLEKRGFLPDTQMLVVDEAHCIREATVNLIKSRPDLLVFGLTATPLAKGMSKTYSNVVNVTTTNRLIETKFLVPVKMYAAKAVDMTGAKVVAGEWSDREIADRGKEIVGDIVSEWVDKTFKHFGGPAKTIVFAATVDHGEELCRQFNAAGYNFQQISYRDTNDDRRRELIAEFRKSNSAIDGLVACEIFSKGFDCVLEGTPVLTDRGEVSIEEVQLSDRVWDGEEFVSHRGSVFKGVRNVISYAGITATPDHLVSTAAGWTELGEVAKHAGRITKTGNGARPIRVSEGATQGSEGEVREPESRGIPGLRGEGNSVRVSIGEGGRHLGSGEHGPATSRNGVGQDQQQRPLRTVESEVVESFHEQLAHEAPTEEPLVPSDPIAPPRDQVCGQDASESVVKGTVGRGDSREVPSPVGQTKGRVWDILSAGPRNRFTAAGLLIHNCPDVKVGISARPYKKSLSSHIQQLGRVMRPALGKEFAVWLDHSGNVMRFRADVDDIFANGFAGLDDGALETKQRKEPTEEEKKQIKCAGCGYVLSAAMRVCPSCGKERARRSLVESVAGVMVAVDHNGNSIPNAFQDRGAVWRQLIGYSLDRKNGDVEAARKFAFAQYMNIYGSFPASRWNPEQAEAVTLAVVNRVRSNLIRWRHSKDRKVSA